MKNNEEKEIIIKDIAGEFYMLGNRYTGELIRERIKNEIDNGNIVILNFDGISGITQGFGDEIIGILVRAFGPDYIKGKVKLKNETPLIKSILNWVYKYSKRMHERGTNDSYTY